MSIMVPVAFLVFNRPDLTAKVFDAIAAAKPRKLLVVADGSRSPEESVTTSAVRSVMSRVDWDCEVLTNYSETNLGCKRRVSSGLDWVFEHCEEAIIIEDDCLPHPTFFPYCEALLDKYRDDERVMMVSGTNFQYGRARSPFSYDFSRTINVWGWATWRRAWRHYDVEMKLWPALSNTPWLVDVLPDPAVAQWWHAMLADAFANRIDTWDFQWAFACWTQNGLNVLPSVNLVSNIGFRNDGTHTASANNPIADLPVGAIEFPLHPPLYMLPNLQADLITFRKLGCVAGNDPVGLLSRIRQSLSLLASNLLRNSTGPPG